MTAVEENIMDWIINLILKTIQLAKEKQFSHLETFIAVTCVLIGGAVFYYLKYKKGIPLESNQEQQKEKKQQASTSSKEKQKEATKKPTKAANTTTSRKKKEKTTIIQKQGPVQNITNAESAINTMENISETQEINTNCKYYVPKKSTKVIGVKASGKSKVNLRDTKIKVS